MRVFTLFLISAFSTLLYANSAESAAPFKGPKPATEEKATTHTKENKDDTKESHGLRSMQSTTVESAGDRFRNSELLMSALLIVLIVVVIVFWFDSQKHLNLIYDDLKGEFAGLRSRVAGGQQHQVSVGGRDNTVELNARNAEVRQLKSKLETAEQELRRSRSSVDEAQVKLDEAKAQAQSAESRCSQLNEDIVSLRRDLDLARTETQSARLEVMTLKSSLIPASPIGLAASLGDELLSALQGNSPHAISLLGCLGLVKSAEASGMEEEVLLSTIRQFSESFASYHASKGTLPEVVQKDLVSWADALNAQFPGRLEIRVPALGFPVDSRTMTAMRGATKVSSVHSWCVYNSKGSVFAPAKVA